MLFKYNRTTSRKAKEACSASAFYWPYMAIFYSFLLLVRNSSKKLAIIAGKVYYIQHQMKFLSRRNHQTRLNQNELKTFGMKFGWDGAEKRSSISYDLRFRDEFQLELSCVVYLNKAIWMNGERQNADVKTRKVLKLVGIENTEKPSGSHFVKWNTKCSPCSNQCPHKGIDYRNVRKRSCRNLSQHTSCLTRSLRRNLDLTVAFSTCSSRIAMSALHDESSVYSISLLISRQNDTTFSQKCFTSPSSIKPKHTISISLNNYKKHIYHNYTLIVTNQNSLAVQI